MKMHKCKSALITKFMLLSSTDNSHEDDLNAYEEENLPQYQEDDLNTYEEGNQVY